MRVDWTREADDQYKHQLQYLAERSQRAADRLFLDVHVAEDLIARNPGYGRRIGPRVREWGVGKEKRYVLRYVAELAITVIGFWHTSQLRPEVDKRFA